MTDELKKEAEECMHNALFWLKLPISKENVEQGGSYILKLLEPREKRIAELEKENAELKEKLKPENCLKSLAKSGFVKFTCENGNEHKQLTKAKEIIRSLYSVIQDRIDYKGNIPLEDEMYRAKQFLR